MSTASRAKIIVKTFKQWLREQRKKIIDNQANDALAYSSLSPVDNADEDGHYCSALLWALNHRTEKNIRNIALTGPYGSGKSSILKTFQRVYNGKGLHFLPISLATFKEEIREKQLQSSDKQILRLIEISILQQIFYHEEDSKIPDSRFKKIRSYSKSKLWLTTGWLLLFLSACIRIANPDILQQVLLDVYISQDFARLIHYASYAVFFLGLILLLLRSVRIISAITINKVKIQNAEIGLGDSINKSILNNYLDEIVYFFEVTPYNVVIIEDLDRFQETEIFTKLREINQLLNNSEKTRNKNIVFIYAVRDDMFRDKERTKFFDFIIPVIPVINSSNSGQILLEKKLRNNYQFSETVIESLSLFIDDMRLLHNVANEFHLYKLKLDPNLSHDKLLAILLYKNIYPNDFTLLSNNSGVLYECLNVRESLIRSEIEKMDKETAHVKAQLKNLEAVRITDVNELRLIYLCKLMSQLDKFDSFIVNGERIDLYELTADDKFEYVINDNIKYAKFQNQQWQTELARVEVKTNKKFKDLEAEVSSRTYLNRLKDILSIADREVADLRKTLQQLERRRNSINNYKLQDLFRLNHEIQFEKDSPSIELIKVLLKNGLVAEDYLDYITIFYEGSISRADNQFLLCVKSQKRLDFGYKLNKIDKVLEKISPADYESSYIINVDLINYLLSVQSFTKIKNSLFTTLSNSSTESRDFLMIYLDRCSHVAEFIAGICEAWTSFWDFVAKESHYPDELQRRYFSLILKHSSLDDLTKIASETGLRARVIENPELLFEIDNSARINDVLDRIKIQINKADFITSMRDVVEHIYKNHFYKLNSNMLQFFIKLKGEFDQLLFDTSNYKALKISKCPELIAYVEENINEYLVNVYLTIDANTNEDEKYYRELITNSKITDGNVKKIISKVKTRVVNLAHITEAKIRHSLLTGGKVVPTWTNVLFEYNQFGKTLSDPLVFFLSDVENASELSRLKIPKENETKGSNNAFIRALMTCVGIGDKAYELLSKSSPYWYKDLNIQELGPNKVSALITNLVLQPVNENFAALKEISRDLSLQLIEKHSNDFTTRVKDFELDNEDVKLILGSSKFSIRQKESIVESISPDKLEFDDLNLRLIASIIVKDSGFKLKDALLKDILANSSISTEQRVKVFNTKHLQVPVNYIPTFLSSLGEPYSDLTINGRRPLVMKSSSNHKFAEILVAKGLISSFDHEKKGLRLVTFKK